MIALVAWLTEIFTYLTRFFYLVKDAYKIVKWNLVFLGEILKDLPAFLAKLGPWLLDFIGVLPGRASEAVMVSVAKWINLSLAAGFDLGFVAAAMSFPDVLGSVPGLAYFASPFRLDYGVSIVICALSVRFLLKFKPSLPIGKLPRLPGKN